MSKPCKKCGLGEMTGPRYCRETWCNIRGANEWEHLHYKCSQCGYEESAPCADAQTSR